MNKFKFRNQKDKIKKAIYLVYDNACSSAFLKNTSTVNNLYNDKKYTNFLIIYSLK